jgi:hypothetical protein
MCEDGTMTVTQRRARRLLVWLALPRQISQPLSDCSGSVRAGAYSRPITHKSRGGTYLTMIS